jgi:hypothetical protein
MATPTQDREVGIVLFSETDIGAVMNVEALMRIADLAPMLGALRGRQPLSSPLGRFQICLVPLFTAYFRAAHFSSQR